MEVLNSNRGLEPEKVLEMVKADVDRFVGDAPQFDDLTMLCVRYNG
jgi:sigma-B regulation protein RsbU (phosphoserine phosphatase)